MIYIRLLSLCELYEYCADGHVKHEIEKDSKFCSYIFRAKEIAHTMKHSVVSLKVWFWNKSTQTNLYTATHMIIVNCYSMFYIEREIYTWVIYSNDFSPYASLTQSHTPKLNWVLISFFFSHKVKSFIDLNGGIMSIGNGRIKRHPKKMPHIKVTDINSIIIFKFALNLHGRWYHLMHLTIMILC